MKSPRLYAVSFRNRESPLRAMLEHLKQGRGISTLQKLSGGGGDPCSVFSPRVWAPLTSPYSPHSVKGKLQVLSTDNTPDSVRLCNKGLQLGTSFQVCNFSCLCIQQQRVCVCMCESNVCVRVCTHFARGKSTFSCFVQRICEKERFRKRRLTDSLVLFQRLKFWMNPGNLKQKTRLNFVKKGTKSLSPVNKS